MSNAPQRLSAATERVTLGPYTPSASDTNIARWRINGHRASIVVWTAEEWATLADPPADAQRYPCGVWCALRME